MATMAQKQEPTHTTEHVEVNTTQPRDEKHSPENVGALTVVDTENKAAYKGDESDGHVEWGFRNLAAAFFLCMLYTGKIKIRVDRPSTLTPV